MINPSSFGISYITDATWAPDNHHLVVLFRVRRDDQGFGYNGLFIVDSSTAEYKRVLTEHEFGGGELGWGLSWDPMERHLLVNCPTHTEGRMCLVSVTIHQ
jgi:hypothetical protein